MDENRLRWAIERLFGESEDESGEELDRDFFEPFGIENSEFRESVARRPLMTINTGWPGHATTPNAYGNELPQTPAERESLKSSPPRGNENKSLRFYDLKEEKFKPVKDGHYNGEAFMNDRQSHLAVLQHNGPGVLLFERELTERDKESYVGSSLHVQVEGGRITQLGLRNFLGLNESKNVFERDVNEHWKKRIEGDLEIDATGGMTEFTYLLAREKDGKKEYALSPGRVRSLTRRDPVFFDGKDIRASVKDGVLVDLKLAREHDLERAEHGRQLWRVASRAEQEKTVWEGRG